jgi:hypothetical protein
MNAPRFITTVSGVRIGCAYQQPPARVDSDQQRVQAALLESWTAQPMPLWRRVCLAIWRWL